MSLCPVTVGRERELEVLSALVESGGFALVGAGPGMGKTRLLRELADRARAAGASIVWARPEVLADPGPYALIVDLLEELSEAPALHDEAQALAAALVSPSSGAEAPARHLAARTRGLLGRLGSRVVVLVEDLHDADDPSRAVLAHLARSAADDGVALVGTYRSEAVDEGLARLVEMVTRERIGLTIELEPLTADETWLMLHEILGREPTQEEASTISEASDGVPFFVEELASQAEPGTIPQNVSRTVQGRLSRLTPEAKRLVSLASLSPGAIDPRLLAEAAALDEARVPACLVEGVRAGILADADGRLTFRHALVRETVRASFVSVEAIALHSRLADAALSLYKADIGPHARTIAHHLAAADRLSAASTYFVLAGYRAINVGALAEAEMLFNMARDAYASTSATAGLAEVKRRQGDANEALSLLDEALASAAEDGREHVDLVIAKSRILADLRESEAVSVLEGLAVVHDAEQDARLLLARGRAFRGQQVHDEALAALRAGLELAVKREGGESLAAELLLELAKTATAAGDLALARDFGERATRLALITGDPDLIGDSHSAEATRLALEGGCDDALSILDRSRGIVTEGLSSHLALQLDHVRAWVLWRAGHPSEADRFATRLEHVTRARSYGRVVRAWAMVEQGDAVTAAAIADSWWSEIGSEVRGMSNEELEELPEGPDGVAYAMLTDAVLVGFGSEPPTAVEMSRVRKYATFVPDATPDTAAYGHLLSARASLRAGALPEASDAAREAESSGAGDVPLQLAHLYEVQALIAQAEGDTSTGLDLMSAAARAFEGVGNTSDRARSMIAQAALSDEADAVRLLKDALALALSVGATASAHAAERALRDRGVRPRAGRPKGSGTKKGELSAREEEVVTLLASGATNAEIAARLFISGRTVQDHISRAQKRLQVTGRAGLAAWAAKRGLI